MYEEAPGFRPGPGLKLQHDQLPSNYDSNFSLRRYAVDTYLLGQVNRASRTAVKDSGFTFSLLGRFLTELPTAFQARVGAYTRVLHSSTTHLNINSFCGIRRLVSVTK